MLTCAQQLTERDPRPGRPHHQPNPRPIDHMARKAEVEAAMAKGRGRRMSFSAVEQGETDFAAPAHNAFRSCQSDLHRERRVMRFQ